MDLNNHTYALVLVNTIVCIFSSMDSLIVIRKSMTSLVCGSCSSYFNLFFFWLQNVKTFKDVKGCDDAKQELEEVVEYLKNPSKFTRLGGKLPKVCACYARLSRVLIVSVLPFM